jgi:hypothetical protein
MRLNDQFRILAYAHYKIGAFYGINEFVLALLLLRIV